MPREDEIYESPDDISTGSRGSNIYRVPRGIVLTLDDLKNQIPFLIKVREEDIITSSEYSSRIPSDLISLEQVDSRLPLIVQNMYFNTMIGNYTILQIVFMNYMDPLELVVTW